MPFGRGRDESRPYYLLRLLTVNYSLQHPLAFSLKITTEAKRLRSIATLFLRGDAEPVVHDAAFELFAVATVVF